MTWALPEGKLKTYPHFDPQISTKKATRYVLDPAKVAPHKFWPFIKFDISWNKFAPKDENGERKVREVRYCARLDAYIFSYYRDELGQKYENLLEANGLNDVVLAYRKVKSPDNRGKCNIDFAKQAFECIEQVGNCTVFALDISKFFENLIHKKIKRDWCNLVGSELLPDDHFAVFKALTKYSFVDKLELYERLGLFGAKEGENGTKPGYLISRKAMKRDYTRLCSPATFRELVAGEAGAGSIIHKNPNDDRGVPQGAPLSDLIANLYMLEFDVAMKNYAMANSGMYMRYSDDILYITPGNDLDCEKIYRDVIGLLHSKSPGLEISHKKTAIVYFSDTPDGLTSKRLYDCAQGDGEKTQLVPTTTDRRDGIEYLGFRFDGKRIFIRDATISNLRRKIVKACRREAFALAKRYNGSNLDQVIEDYDVSIMTNRFLRVEKFKEVYSDKKKWTFWTYVSRSSKTFGSRGARIPRQLRAIKDWIPALLAREIARAFKKNEKNDC